MTQTTHTKYRVSHPTHASQFSGTLEEAKYFIDNFIENLNPKAKENYLDYWENVHSEFFIEKVTTIVERV